jgi:hypothetical protein
METKDLYAILMMGGVFLVGTFVLPEGVIYRFLVLLLVSVLIVRWSEIDSLVKEVSRTATQGG